MCWIYTPWLGRIVCGSHNRFSPVVVADLLPIWPKSHLFAMVEEKKRGIEGWENTETGRFYPLASITINR